MLNVSGNRLSSLCPFTSLYRLQKLNASHNLISDTEEVEGVVVALSHSLLELDVRGNGCCEGKRYTETVILASGPSLGTTHSHYQKDRTGFIRCACRDVMGRR